jgi:hypothetical protein
MFGKIGRLFGATLIAITVGGHTLIAPAPAAAAVTGLGTGYEATVSCDSLGGLITLQAQASAAPTFNYGQTIAFAYWIYDETIRKPVAGLDPTTIALMTHVRNNVNSGGVAWTAPSVLSAPSYFRLTLNHAYSVWTHYSFWTGSQWLDAGFVKTTWYYNQNRGSSNSYCLM